MLFQVNPPLLLWTVALLASLLVAGALVALIEPLSRRTRLQRVGQLRMVGERKATVYVRA